MGGVSLREGLHHLAEEEHHRHEGHRQFCDFQVLCVLRLTAACRRVRLVPEVRRLDLVFSTSSAAFAGAERGSCLCVVQRRLNPRLRIRARAARSVPRPRASSRPRGDRRGASSS